MLKSLVDVPQQLSGRWGGKREQVILITTGSFTAGSKLQVAGLSSWLLPSLLFHSPVFNWGGKVCLVVHAFLWVLFTFNFLSRVTAKVKRKRKKSTSCGALCQDGLLLSLRVQPKVSLLIIEIVFIHIYLKSQALSEMPTEKHKLARVEANKTRVPPRRTLP